MTTDVNPYDALGIQNPEQAVEIIQREIRTAEDRWAVDQAIRIFANYDPYVIKYVLPRPLDDRERALVHAELKAIGSEWLIPYYEAGVRP